MDYTTVRITQAHHDLCDPQALQNRVTFEFADDAPEELKSRRGFCTRDIDLAGTWNASQFSSPLEVAEALLEDANTYLINSDKKDLPPLIEWLRAHEKRDVAGRLNAEREELLKRLARIDAELEAL